jgi:hypothetical protein
MNFPCLGLALIFAASVMPARAQSDESVAPSTPPAASPVERAPHRGKFARFLESLPPETRKRFEVAREKALQDPKLQELREAAANANKAFFRAMREKMLQIDPSLAEIVKQRAEQRKDWKDRKEEKPSFGNLSDDELEKLIRAREKAKSDPIVQAAEKRRREARSAEEQDAASDAYAKAIREAALRAGPFGRSRFGQVDDQAGVVPQSGRRLRTTQSSRRCLLPGRRESRQTSNRRDIERPNTLENSRSDLRLALVGRPNHLQPRIKVVQEMKGDRLRGLRLHGRAELQLAMMRSDEV